MVTKISRQKSRVIILLSGLLFSMGSSALVEGEVQPTGGPKMYNISIDNTNIINNQAGETFEFPFQIADGFYSGTAYCTIRMDDQPMYYTATATLLQPSTSPGYLKLNDYMDVKVEIYIGGGRREDFTVPFYNFSNNAAQNPCTPPSYFFDNNFSTGARGKVTFKITKPIINGVNLRGTEIAKIYGRVGELSSAMGSIPMAIVTINSGIITVPDKCTFNSGLPISVDFRSIPSSGSLLNGTNYSQPLDIKVKCEGGSFATKNLNIRMGIQQANTASFNPDYLGTTGAVDRSNLGIMLKDSGGNLIAANKLYDVPNLVGNQGTWSLTAAPIAEGGTDVVEGDFQASATVIAEFQ